MMRSSNRKRNEEDDVSEFEEDDENVFDVDQADDQFENDGRSPPPEQAAGDEPPRREFKYSTADLNESGPCKKYCMIILLFLAMMLFMIGLSMLLKHFFFSDTSDNAPNEPERPVNSSFPEDKMVIDQVCSRGTFEADGGERCREACIPHFFECCDPFNEFDLYGIIEENNKYGLEENQTMAPTTLEYKQEMDLKLATCSLDTELRGCMAYSKCQAIGKQIEPAPSTLPILCNKHHLDLDPVSCRELCKEVRCCYSDGKDNCMADNFDICMDYAPCQNLRKSFVLETAPDDLDQACFWQQPECMEVCRQAECCGDPESSCLQDNFMACLTYAPCTGVTRTDIIIPPQFSVVREPPVDLKYACEAHHALQTGIHVPEPEKSSDKTCAQHCEEVLCCWANNHVDNCFFEDPLGCLAWEAQCQVLFQ